jgi:hypothetical protein
MCCEVKFIIIMIDHLLSYRASAITRLTGFSFISHHYKCDTMCASLVNLWGLDVEILI